MGGKPLFSNLHGSMGSGSLLTAANQELMPPNELRSHVALRS